MSRAVQSLLSDKFKGTQRAQGILCYMFRHVLLWRKVGITSWDRRAQLYFEKPHNRDNPDKGNLNKALTQDDFTWPTFKKAIDFLNPISAVFIVQLTWKSGRVSRYPVIIDPAENEEELDDQQFGGSGAENDIFANKKKPTNTLARLFRQIVQEEGIDLTRWNALFENYVKNPLHGIPQNRRDMNTVISTWQRDLLAPRLSWIIFRRGILVLAPVQEEYILELRWSNTPGDVTLHPVTIRDPLSIKPSFE